VADIYTIMKEGDVKCFFEDVPEVRKRKEKKRKKKEKKKKKRKKRIFADVVESVGPSKCLQSLQRLSRRCVKPA
jgi:hypothetical protein